VPGGRVQGAPHAPISRKGGVHHQHVANALVVGVVICEIVEDDEGIEEGHGEDQRYFGDAQGHGFSGGVKVWK
jgi:hypothetical protein